MTYFKNVKSFEDLKEQFRNLARKNHPDAGGDAEIMKAINSEYDELFPIWKHRHNATAAEPTTETAEGTRRKFYTEYGWEGDLYDADMSLKSIANNIRSYVKEIYPTYKFSITTEYASMCQELHVALMEAPAAIYKENPEELTEEERTGLLRKLRHNNLFTLNRWTDAEFNAAILKVWNENGDSYKVFNEVAASVIADVNREVNRYNMDDSDSMIDYFDVNFYYFGCRVGKWDKPFKVVEKTARVKDNQTTTPATKEPIANEYEVKEDIHTQTGAKIWVVKILRTLTRDEYLAEAERMDARGGYYSKFKHGFIFKQDPTELLTA